MRKFRHRKFKESAKSYTNLCSKVMTTGLGGLIPECTTELLFPLPFGGPQPHKQRAFPCSQFPAVGFLGVCGCVHMWVHDLSVSDSLATPLTTDHQAPLSMEFQRQESWNELPVPPPRDLPDPGIKPRSLAFPALADGFFTTLPAGKPIPVFLYNPLSYHLSRDMHLMWRNWYLFEIFVGAYQYGI